MSENEQVAAKLLASSDPNVVAATLLAVELGKLAQALGSLASEFSYHGGYVLALREMTSQLCEELGSG